jgi:hypothetical protein
LKDRTVKYYKQEGNWVERGKKSGKTWNIHMSDCLLEWQHLLKYLMKMCLHFQRMVCFHVHCIWGYLVWCFALHFTLAWKLDFYFRFGYGCSYFLFTCATVGWVGQLP